jgi:putative ABC transport system permease protein
MSSKGFKHFPMIGNYFRVGIRNMLKHKGFSLINTLGLAMAMSICMLIILMLADEKRYDQFNEGKDRTYRILSDKPEFGSPYATSPVPLAAELRNNYPAIEATSRLMMGVGGDAIYNQKSVEMRGFFADTSFFRIFSFVLEKGDRVTALSMPHSVVITSAVAHQLFNDEDPIGKSIEFVDRGLNYLGGENAPVPVKWGNFTVTGVIADKNYKSHLRFDALVSSPSIQALSLEKKIGDPGSNWEDYYKCYTYVLMKPGKSSRELEASLNSVVSHKYAGLKDFAGFKLTGQPLTGITPGILLGNTPTISLPMIAYYFLSLLALIIMISACMNYINLSVARALTRAKEIGIRKVGGALRKDLILQFLSESVLTALFALVLSAVMLLLIRYAFINFWVNQYLDFDLRGNVWVYIVFILFALLIGLAAGLYPALYLSRFQPIKALNLKGMRPGKLVMRKVLSVSQFVVSLFFIITSILIFKQFRKFLEFKYEFNTKNIVNVDLQTNDYKKVAAAFNSVSGVSGVSACEYIPGTGRSEGINLSKRDDKEEFKGLMLLQTDENFISNMGLKLIAGRNLPAAGNAADKYIVVNEAAVKEFGYGSSADIVGRLFRVKENDSTTLEVIGVVQNFHVRLLMDDDKIAPLVLQNQPAHFQYVNVKISSPDFRGTIAKLQDSWKSIDAAHPLKYVFFNEQLAATSQGIFDIVSILGYLAFLAVTIACLGMLGMATYTTERRMKEVGIRKVLGAEDRSIVLLLSREFLRILAIAILIAVPLSYFANHMWLRKFPNRVDFGMGTIFSGVLVLLILGLLTIGSQTIRAARKKPVDAIRID